MTENKIKPTISQVIYCLKAECERYSEVCEECQLYAEVGCDHCYDDVTDMAIQALEEIQAYRAIETELKDKYHANVDIKGLVQYFIQTIFEGEKHEGFCILTNEDAKMWDEYRAIGTVEECRNAVERMKPKKKVMEMVKSVKCANCGSGCIDNYCSKCGQAIDWSE